MQTTRFAPSPTGYLHLGHAYAALFARKAALEVTQGGKFLLRIEDIDPVRCKPEFTAAIIEDLGWLGLECEQPVRLQSAHLGDYTAALNKLRRLGVIYPCFCTRQDIAEATTAPHLVVSDPVNGPDGLVYTGTCRHLSMDQRDERMARGEKPCQRLDMAKALTLTGGLVWHDREQGEIAAQPQDFGDVVLARKDVPTSYHLSVTVDDALQGITLVTRGRDLFRATDIHRVLQALLGLPVPDYHHHGLLTDAEGRRYAKRDRAATIRSLREAGKTSAEVRAMLPPLS